MRPQTVLSWFAPRPLLVATAAVALAMAAAPASAQRGGGGLPGQGFGGGGQPVAPPPKEKPRERVQLPPPPPTDDLRPEMEEARERAKEPGVLVAKTPKSGFIYELRVDGARKIEPDAVLVYIQSRVDQRPDSRTIAADVRRIYQMGLFADVVVTTERGPEGSVILSYRLAEKPAINQVVLEGNEDVSEDDIREVIDIKAFQVLNVARVRTNLEKISKLYVDKGFFLVEVDYELRPSDGSESGKDQTPGLLDGTKLLDFFSQDQNPDGTKSNAPPPKGAGDPDVGAFVDVVFTVVEHAKVKVEDINVIGNSRIHEDELKQVLRTRENHPLGILTEWGTYKEELAEVDLLAIEAYYQDNGYINIQVGKPRVVLTPDKTRMHITIPVTEGEQYSLRGFGLGGDLLIEDPVEFSRIRAEEPDRVVFLKSRLLDLTKVKPGEVFSRSKVAQDVLSVTDAYRDRGYAYVNIVPQTQVFPEDDTIDLQLAVSAGPRVTIERVEITGNTKTQDRVIRRELRVYEGEFFNATGLRLSEQRVTALGFFETVNVTTRQGSAPDRMVIVMDVKEKATGTFQLGAGFSNAEQFIFTGQIAQNNFLGRGHTVSGSVQWSRLRQIVDFRFIDPYAFYLFQEPITFALSLFNTQRNFLDFFRNSLGADITFGYPVGRPFRALSESWLELTPRPLRPYVPDLENFQLFLTFNGERVEIGEQSFDVRIFGLEGPRYTTSLRASLLFDQRNNRLFPTQGYYFQAAAEFASPFLGAAAGPEAETFGKNALLNAGLKDGLGFLKTNGQANSFQRYTFTARGYYSFDDILPITGVVLKGNLEVGFLNTEDRSLIFEHYFLGGFNTVRGYFPRSLGPVLGAGGLLPDGNQQDFRIGGNKQVYTNVELEFPIFEQVGIRGVLFMDAGNAFGHDENFFYVGNEPDPVLARSDCGGTRCFDPVSDLPLGLYMSAGIGIRWFSPIGPLRFEWGFPLSRRPAGTPGFIQGDEPVQFEFNIGNSF